MWPEVDRRENPRVEIAVPVKVGDEDPIEGQSRDVSTEGMRIELNASLAVATEITVAFDLPDVSSTFAAVGEVRWRKQIGPKSANRWVVGVSFGELPEEQHRRLAAYLEDATRDTDG